MIREASGSWLSGAEHLTALALCLPSTEFGRFSNDGADRKGDSCLDARYRDVAVGFLS
jgi:hypothetical protein